MAQPADSLADSLFGEIALDRIIAAGGRSEVGRQFALARDSLVKGDAQAARTALEAITQMQSIESRFVIVAWRSLREAGGKPPTDLEKVVLGVIVEVGMPKGHDILAAYSDHTARYYNYSGAGVVWERPDQSLDIQIDALLAAASAVVARIGPWESVRRPAPDSGVLRLNILTPAGLHFGEGDIQLLGRDTLAGPAVQAATNLMRSLTSMARR